MPGAKHYHRPSEEMTTLRRPPRPRWQWALLGAGAALALTTGILLALLLSSPAEIKALGTKTPGGVDGTLRATLLDLERARRVPLSEQPPAVQVSLSDADVDEYVAGYREALPFPIELREPRVAFHAGQVVGGARAKLWILPVRVTVALTPQAADGRLQVRVDSLRVGRLPVPGAYRERLRQEAQNAVNSALHETDFRLETLEVTPGRLTVSLRPPRL